MLDKKADKEVLVNCQSLGLSEKEALVYVALLRLGEVGSSKIITETGLHGQYVYQALAGLEQKGLVQHVIIRGRQKFSAKNPSVLVNLAEEKRILADKLADQLSQLMVLPQAQRFEVYQGTESYVAHEFELLKQAPFGCELSIVGGSGDRFMVEMGKRLPEYVSLQLKKDIKIRYIGSEEQRQSMTDLHGLRKNFSIRYLPGLFTGQVNTNIWPEAIGFNIYGEPVTRFTIFNEVVAQSHAKFFEALWCLAKE